MGHIGIEILTRLLMDRLGASEAESVRAHLNRPCVRCQRDLELLAQLRSALGDSRLQDAPPELLHQARAAFRDRVRLGLVGPKRPKGGWIAELIYDSLKVPQLAGARGIGSGRQLLYRIGELDLDLRLAESRRGQRSLHGQLLARAADLPSMGISLRVAARNVERRPDTLGQFQFSKLPTRAFTLELRASGRTVARIRLPGTQRASLR